MQRIAMFAGSLLALGYVFYTLDMSALLSEAAGIRMFPAMAATALIALSQYISALRMRYYLRFYGTSISIAYAIRLYFRSLFFNTILPGGIGGDAYKCRRLYKHHAMPAPTTLRCALAERASGLFTLLMLGILAAGYSIDDNDIARRLASCYISAGALCVLVLCYRIGTRYVTKETQAVSGGAFVFSSAIQLLQLSAFALCVSAFPATASLSAKGYAAYITVFAPATAASVLPISVGGLGVRELVFLHAADYVTIIQPEHAALSTLLFFIAGYAVALIGLRLPGRGD